MPIPLLYGSRNFSSLCFFLGDLQCEMVLQNMQGRCVKRTLSNGSSLLRDKRGRPGEEGLVGRLSQGTGRPRALPATSTLQTIGWLEWRRPWFSTKAKLLLAEKPSGRCMSTEPLKQIQPPLTVLLRFQRYGIPLFLSPSLSEYCEFSFPFSLALYWSVEAWVHPVPSLCRIRELQSIWSTAPGHSGERRNQPASSTTCCCSCGVIWWSWSWSGYSNNGENKLITWKFVFRRRPSSSPSLPGTYRRFSMGLGSTGWALNKPSSQFPKAGGKTEFVRVGKGGFEPDSL